MSRSRTLALGTASLAALCATSVAAQTDAERIAQLEQRIATLEEAKSPLSFNTDGGTTFELYGYIKADFSVDFGADLGNSAFGLINLDGTDDGEYFNGTLRQTRLGFRTFTPTRFGELETMLETDFYGGAGDPDSDGELRLRHANVMLAGFRVGKYWTTFMPIASYPSTLDFQGIGGIPFAREEQIRYTFDIGQNFVSQIAIEESISDSDDPVLVGTFAYDTDPLLLRASAITGTVNDGLGGDTDVYGINLSTTASVWEGGEIMAAYTYGEGIGSYLVFFGADRDTNASGDAVEVQSAYIGLNQSVGERWTLRGLYGYLELEEGTMDQTESLTTLHVNAEYQIVDSTSLGIEYFYGTRDTFAGDSYDVDRVQASVTFSF